ncbi:MAG: right-handed parallel beta-helix repeat-containing protein [Thermoplasmatales archaeon]|nr:MAG: right-handed parallel beta-helix repeat-containing protein [Thermoplasmatales archaeon]
METKKILVLGIIFLFIIININPSAALIIKNSNSSNPSSNILYVGGSGEGNYTKIQDAIDNASVGDTVFVYEDSSPYNEDVIVNKGIMLVGEDKNTTLINGSKFGDVVIINSDNVLFSGFMIHGYNSNGLIIDSNNNIVSNNFFSDCFRGIILNDSTSDNEIFNNTINDCFIGIKFIESSNNKICNNLISNSFNAMLVWYKSVNNQIINNTFESSRDFGIRLSTTSATLSGNIFSNNKAGLVLSYCSDNIIKNNCFINDGLYIYKSYRNNVKNNTINGKPLIYFENESNIIIDDSAGQVFLVSCNNMTVRNLEFTNASMGVGFFDTVDSKIENNIFSNLNKYAMRTDNCENVTIQNNLIENPTEYGGITSSNGLFNCTIKNNVIRNLDHNAIYVVGINCTISDNNISNNSNGICIGGHNNTINNNSIYNNKYSGVLIRHYSENNTVIRNNIVKNDIGIKLYAVRNLILKNNIKSNNIGFNISYRHYNYSCIYYNNFINNNLSAIDKGNNTWDNGYPLGGNYWDDYTGEDADGDGIGDIPYLIPGGDNKDRYPLIVTWIGNPPIANFTYNAEEYPVIFNASFSYDFDGEIISYEWDFGDGTTGTGETVYHKYCEVGTYYVTLTVTDDDGFSGNITKCVDVMIANTPPGLEIYGPNSGNPGVEYEYEFYVIDPDPDDFYLWVDWGDGDSTGWIGPYQGGGSVKHSHIWNETGTYMMKAKVRDFCGESEWAEFEVEIPRIRTEVSSLFFRLIERFSTIFPKLRYLLRLIQL